MSKLLSVLFLGYSIWCVHSLGVAFFDVYLFAIGGLYFLVDSAVDRITNVIKEKL